MEGGLKICKKRSLPPVPHPSSGLRVEVQLSESAIRLILCSDTGFPFKFVCATSPHMLIPSHSCERSPLFTPHHEGGHRGADSGRWHEPEEHSP